jgi:hypothetical protein
MYLKTFGCVAQVKRVGPGVTKPADRSIPMVFIGYEVGTKGYRFFDPAAKKLHVSRNVIFEESKPLDWQNSVHADPITSIPEVEQYTIVGQETENGEIVEAGTPLQGSPQQGQWGYNEVHNEATLPGSPLVLGIQFAIPPSGQQVDSEGVQQRFRTVQNLNDTTEEDQDFNIVGCVTLQLKNQQV